MHLTLDYKGNNCLLPGSPDWRFTLDQSLQITYGKIVSLKHNFLPLEEVVPPLFRTFFLRLTSATGFSQGGRNPYLLPHNRALRPTGFKWRCTCRGTCTEEPTQWKWITMLKAVTPEPAWGSSGQAKQQHKNIRNVNISLTISITKKSWCLSDIFLITPVMSSGSKHR